MRTWWSMTKMRELLRPLSGTSTATMDLVARAHLLMTSSSSALLKRATFASHGPLSAA
jgi:hypothetical protein